MDSIMVFTQNLIRIPCFFLTYHTNLSHQLWDGYYNNYSNNYSRQLLNSHSGVTLTDSDGSLTLASLIVLPANICLHPATLIDRSS